MPAILVSVKNETWKKMKKHPEIKWTQVMRERAEAYLDEVEGITTGDEIRRRLGKEFVKSIDSATKEQAKTNYKKLKESEWRRQALLTRLRTSKARKG